MVFCLCMCGELRGRAHSQVSRLIGWSYALALAAAAPLCALSRAPLPPMLAHLAVGALSAFVYTGGPGLKYKALGDVLISGTFGPLLVSFAYLVQAGRSGWGALLASLPLTAHIEAILHANNARDVEEDRANGAHGVGGGGGGGVWPRGVAARCGRGGRGGDGRCRGSGSALAAEVLAAPSIVTVLTALPRAAPVCAGVLTVAGMLGRRASFGLYALLVLAPFGGSLAQAWRRSLLAALPLLAAPVGARLVRVRAQAPTAPTTRPRSSRFPRRHRGFGSAVLHVLRACAERAHECCAQMPAHAWPSACAARPHRTFGTAVWLTCRSARPSSSSSLASCLWRVCSYLHLRCGR